MYLYVIIAGIITFLLFVLRCIIFNPIVEVAWWVSLVALVGLFIYAGIRQLRSTSPRIEQAAYITGAITLLLFILGTITHNFIAYLGFWLSFAGLVGLLIFIGIGRKRTASPQVQRTENAPYIPLIKE